MLLFHFLAVFANAFIIIQLFSKEVFNKVVHNYISNVNKYKY